MMELLLSGPFRLGPFRRYQCVLTALLPKIVFRFEDSGAWRAVRAGHTADLQRCQHPAFKPVGRIRHLLEAIRRVAGLSNSSGFHCLQTETLLMLYLCCSIRTEEVSRR